MYAYHPPFNLDAMEDPKDLEQLFFIMNNNNSDELSTLSICQKFIKRITFSDTVTAFTGVISDELLSQQDSLFSFSEVVIPRSPIYAPFTHSAARSKQSPPPRAALQHHALHGHSGCILRAYFSLPLSTLVNTQHTTSLNDLVHHLAVYNTRIRTNLNGTQLTNENYEKLQQQLHVNSKPVTKADLTALFNKVHEAMNSKAPAAQNFENLQNLQSVYQSINSQLSVVMKVKNESVEGDLETFRCLFSGV